ncbi:MAG: hypothetical protein KIG95_13740 [Comamonas sp.]|nr:hypothetical protein [Comamonas sp.]
MPTSRRNQRTEKLLALFVLGWLLLSFPLFSIWDRPVLIGGWPLLPTAAYAIWLLLILVLAWLMERGSADEDTPPAEPAADAMPYAIDPVKKASPTTQSLPQEPQP